MIAAIGDIHGESTWRELMFTDDNYKNFEKIIFIGDYVDSFHIIFGKQTANLLDIVDFKKANPDKVILLLGNHDVHYINPDYKCSGFDTRKFAVFNNIFKENSSLFQLSYLHKDHLFTHAGVSNSWLMNLLSDCKPEIEEFYQNNPIDVFLNELYKQEHKSIFQCSKRSGGSDAYSGPLWLRPDERVDRNIPNNYNQIFGHTACSELTKFELPNGNYQYLIDCLEYSGEMLTLNI